MIKNIFDKIKLTTLIYWILGTFIFLVFSKILVQNTFNIELEPNYTLFQIFIAYFGVFGTILALSIALSKEIHPAQYNKYFLNSYIKYMLFGTILFVLLQYSNGFYTIIIIYLLSILLIYLLISVLRTNRDSYYELLLDKSKKNNDNEIINDFFNNIDYVIRSKIEK